MNAILCNQLFYVILCIFVRHTCTSSCSSVSQPIKKSYRAPQCSKAAASLAGAVSPVSAVSAASGAGVSAAGPVLGKTGQGSWFDFQNQGQLTVSDQITSNTFVDHVQKAFVQLRVVCSNISVISWHPKRKSKTAA